MPVNRMLVAVVMADVVKVMRLLPSFTVSRFDAEYARNAPSWHEQQRAYVIPGLRKAGVPEWRHGSIAECRARSPT